MPYILYKSRIFQRGMDVNLVDIVNRAIFREILILRPTFYSHFKNDAGKIRQNIGIFRYLFRVLSIRRPTFCKPVKQGSHAKLWTFYVFTECREKPRPS